MAKRSTKTPIRRKASKKKSFSWIKFFFVTLAIFLFSFGIYHYRNAILYYFSFKTDKIYKVDKVTQARIYQVLSNQKNTVFGFDISQYQNEINWAAIDSVEGFKLDFVFIRATAGVNKKDEKFDTNWKQAKKYGFVRGAYHYYRPNENSVDQANNFIKGVNLQKGDFPPVLDIEQLPQNQSIDSLKLGLKKWLDIVEKQYHVKPIIYSGEKYYTDFLKDDFKGYTFWIANYNFWVEDIKDDWLFWQFTDKAAIHGINENVDINIYNGSLNNLFDLTISK